MPEETMYDRILRCCAEKGLTPGAVCNAIGVRRGMITELKTGRTKELAASNVYKFAKYLNVSCDYLITGHDFNFDMDSEERTLINCWKRATDDERENVAFILRNYGMPLPQDDVVVEVS